MLVELVVLVAHVVARLLRAELRPAQDRRHVEALGLPVVDRPADVEEIGPPDRLVDRAQAEETARSSRTSWAMNSMKFTTCSAFPVKRERSVGFWVATPTGHVSRWHTRIMM